MRRLIALIILLAVVSNLAGCFPHFDKDRALGIYDNALSLIGRSHLTSRIFLIGDRDFDDSDGYTGSYDAKCKGRTGRDVIFGGTSIYERKIKLTVHIVTDGGSATLSIRTGETVACYQPDELGDIELTLSFDGGSNYIMLDYDGFRGTVTLTSEYR